MEKVIAHSTICGYDHEIEALKEGSVFVLKIKTNCEKIKKMDGMRIPQRSLFDIKDNPVMAAAQELQCSANCIVPCAVLNACWLEAGMMAKSLVEKEGPLTIEFV
ncbi:hypothetical protein EF808_04170 [archaeon]|nr:MAG: hypothetical protein EF808_04170 [archaeon]